MKNIIIITGLGGGLGSGHYHRSLKLAKKLRLRSDQFFCLTENQPIVWGIAITTTTQMLSHIPNNTKLAIFDVREELSPKFLWQFRKREMVLVGLDLLGKIHAHFDYVINGIPSLALLGEANLNGTKWLPPPAISIKRKKMIVKKIVVFLGHQDKGATFDLLTQHQDICHRLKLGNHYFFSIYLGRGNGDDYHYKIKKLMRERTIEGEVHLQSEAFFPDLKNCALLICHFGLSGLEALNFKVPTVFWNITFYHHQLTQKHFPNLILGFDNKVMMRSSLSRIVELCSFYQQNSFLGKKYALLPGVFKDLATFFSLNKELSPTVIHRRPEGNFYKNTLHEWIEYRPFIQPKTLGKKRISYGENYFFTEYQQSYGRTYKEDQENIYNLSQERLNIITKYILSGELLDIGCALGYFLDKASERGFRTNGIEISHYGYEQAQKKHRVFQGDFCDLNLKSHYDVITLWYVIEHFVDIFSVLKKIASLQSIGSLMALSTPNARGLLGRFSLNNFLENSPTDHYYLFDPQSLKKALASFGYRLLKIRYTGIYHSRFKRHAPKFYQFIPKIIYPFWARELGWGDTFEMYFLKIR